MTNSGLNKDAYFFPHDSNAKRDPKMLMLRHQLGAEGYGLYWMLVEDLREQNNYSLPLGIIPALADEYKTSVAKLEAVIKSFNLFDVTEDKFFYSPSLLRRMEKWDNKKIFLKQRAEKAALARWNKPEANTQAMQEQCLSNANAMQNDAYNIREDKRREDKIREDKNKQIQECVFSILSYFNFNEISNPDKLRLAADFCNTLNHRNRLDFFIAQFAGYQKYKAASGEKRHGFASFLGSYESHFEDGGWNARNWAQETPQTLPSAASYVSDIDEKMKLV